MPRTGPLNSNCNKFPDGGPSDYLAPTKLTVSETGTFDNLPPNLRVISTLTVVYSFFRVKFLTPIQAKFMPIHVKEQDAISVATSWLKKVTKYDQNFLEIPRTLFIWLRVACNTLVVQQLTLELDFATVSLLWSLRKRLVR